MKGFGILCAVAIGIVLLLVVAWIGIYNGLVSSDQAAAKAWGDTESTLQRRSDLVPNLVEVVKAYAKHEKEVFTAVTEARAKVGQVKINAGDAEAMKKFAAAQGELSSALSRLMIVAENYPLLKADRNFLELQSQLEGTENRINVARQRYNGAVATYNSNVKSFFGSIVAGSRFKEREYFKADEGAKKAPVVKF